MNITDTIFSEIHRLASLDRHPKFIYLGENEYRDLKLLVSVTSDASLDLRYEFMGVEIVRVSRSSHFDVTY